jgi:MATE family multidrug resistance protein
VDDLIENDVMAKNKIVGNAAAAPAHLATEARALLKLGLPLAATQLAQMAVMTTDTVMLGRLGPLDLAAGAIGFTLYIFGWLVASGPIMAVSPIIAQALGHDPAEIRAVRRTVRMSFWSIAICAAPILGLYAAAPIALKLLGQNPAIIALAAPYVFVLAPGMLFALGYAALRNFLSALGHTRLPLIISALLVALNALFDYAFIFGKFGAPRLEIVGAGLATTLSNAISFALLAGFVLVAPAFRRYEILARLWQPDWGKLRELFRIGVPITVTIGFELTLFQAGTFLMGTIGTAELAANQIAMNVASITFMVPLGLAMAGTVRVGLAAGAGDPVGARRAAALAIALGAGFMALAGFTIILLRPLIAGLYVDAASVANAPVISLAVRFLALAALFQVFDATQVTAAHALRGLKDTRVPALLAGVSYWLIGLPCAALLAFGAKLGGTGIWIGYVMALGTAAALLVGRLHLLTRQRRPSAPSQASIEAV